MELKVKVPRVREDGYFPSLPDPGKRRALRQGPVGPAGTFPRLNKRKERDTQMIKTVFEKGMRIGSAAEFTVSLAATPASVPGAKRGAKG